MKNFIINVLKWLKALLGDRELPSPDPEDKTFVVNLSSAINFFRVNNYLMPFEYVHAIELLAKDHADTMYAQNKLIDTIPSIKAQYFLRKKNIDTRSMSISVVKADNFQDVFNKIRADETYRGMILDGFNTMLGIGKCGEFTAVIFLA
jgi:hypothetical protein